MTDPQLPAFNGFQSSLPQGSFGGLSIASPSQSLQASNLTGGTSPIKSGNIIGSQQSNLLSGGYPALQNPLSNPIVAPQIKSSFTNIPPAAPIAQNQEMQGPQNLDQLLAHGRMILSDIQKNGISNGTSNVPSASDTPPVTTKNFTVPQTNTFDSSALSNNNNMSGVMQNRQSKLDDLLNNTNTNGIPSDNLLRELAGKIYNSSLYTSAEQTALQNLSDVNSKISDRKLQETTQIKNLLNNGQITKEQASGVIDEIHRRANEDLAFLANTQQAATNQLGVYGMIRGNQTTALQNVQGLLKPEQVSPGSTLYNPITGVQYQGQGAAPAQIASTAQDLEQSALRSGTIQYNQDGTVNHNAYLQQAQQYYQSGAYGGQTTPGQMGGTSGGGQNQLQSIAQGLVNGTISPSQASQYGINPSLLFQAANQISMQTKGTPFNATQSQANAEAQSQALNQNATAYRTLANAQTTAISHLDDLSNYFKAIPSTQFPAINRISNWIQSNLGNQGLQSYNTALQAARGEIAKVLAGGGAPSDAENKSASAVLPDNMSASQLKGAIDSAKLLMQQKIDDYGKTSNIPQFGNTSAKSSGGNSNTTIGKTTFYQKPDGTWGYK